MAFILFGIVVGMLSGTLGIGGGVVLVPGLMILFGLTQLEAQGTSLAVLSLPICLAAAAVYYQNGHVRPGVAGLVALGFVVGAVAGSKFVQYIPGPLLRPAFGALLVYLGLRFVLEGRVAHTAAALPSLLGALLMTIAARKWRRRHAELTPLAPPTADFEYHI